MSNHGNDELDTGDALEGAFISSVSNSDLSGIATDVGEVGLDALLDEGVLNEIPVLGILAKAYNVFGTVNNRLFAKKLIRFLANLADVPVEQRRQQISKLAVDSQYRQQVGEQLLLVLDRMNDMQKPILLAYAFKAYLQGAIEYSVFQRVSHSLDLLQMSAIERLKGIYDGGNWMARVNQLAGSAMESDPELQHLAFCGLLTVKWHNINDMELGDGRPVGGHSANEFGKTFCDILLSRREITDPETT